MAGGRWKGQKCEWEEGELNKMKNKFINKLSFHYENGNMKMHAILYLGETVS